jgi:hypothetical protein
MACKEEVQSCRGDERVEINSNAVRNKFQGKPELVRFTINRDCLVCPLLLHCIHAGVLLLVCHYASQSECSA